MRSPFRYLLRLNLLFILVLSTLSCTRNSDSSAEDVGARKSGAVLDAGELTDSSYKNSFLDLEVPLVSGWESGDHDMVVRSLEAWNPDSGIQAIPSMFLLSIGAPPTDQVQRIVNQYFLQIEATSLYPEFQADPQAYLSAVGQALVTQAGQTLDAAPHTEKLGNREVQRMDISFMFGTTPGRQTYYSWEDKGLFVNLVFTYASQDDWDLLSSSVVEDILLN